MLFLPTGQRGFGILASTFHYFVGSMKTETGGKTLWFEKVGGEGIWKGGDFLGGGG